MTDEAFDDLLTTLKVAGDRCGGALRLLKASSPEELTVTLLGELRRSVADAAEALDGRFGDLARCLATSTRQATVRDFNVAVTYGEDEDRVR